MPERTINPDLHLIAIQALAQIANPKIQSAELMRNIATQALEDIATSHRFGKDYCKCGGKYYWENDETGVCDKCGKLYGE